MICEKAIRHINAEIRKIVESFDRPKPERFIRYKRNKTFEKRIYDEEIPSRRRIITSDSAVSKQQIESETETNLRNQSVIVMNAQQRTRTFRTIRDATATTLNYIGIEAVTAISFIPGVGIIPSSMPVLASGHSPHDISRFDSFRDGFDELANAFFQAVRLHFSNRVVFNYQVE